MTTPYASATSDIITAVERPASNPPQWSITP
jgi:hypothetical protein